MKRRLTALVCALALTLSLLPTASLADGSQAAARSYDQTEAIGRGLSVTTRTQRGENGSARQMYVLDYTPGQAVRPIVAYGAKLYGKSDIGYAVEYAQSLGYTVMAAVNADYFSFESGIPTGMLIQGGRLCVSDGAWNAVAFFEDGTAMAGAPRLNIHYTRNINAAVTNLYALNKVRTGAGIYLYSEDFSSTTRTTAAGTEVVLQLAQGDCLRLGQPVEATVVDIRAAAGTAIGPNQLVMSLQEANTVGASFGDLAIGEVITLSCTTQNPRWHEATWCVGGGNMLAQEGALTSSAVAGQDARTVLGVRADGSVSVLVCDGRQAGLSDGISLLEAAQTLLARGCVDVINLDGGGSTTLSYRDAGFMSVDLKNSPSEGEPRKCANFLLFVNSGDSTLPETTMVTYPRSALVLAGAALPLEGRGISEDYYPKSRHTEGFAILSGSGEIAGGLFLAPETAETVLVGSSSPNLSSIPASIQVVEHPATLSLVRAGTAAPLTTLAVGMDSVTDLDVYLTDGLRPITAQDGQFTFHTTGGIGAIDENGVLTAGSAPGLTGTVTATWRDYTITLGVTVGRAPAVLDNFESESLYGVIAPELEDVANTATGTATVSTAPEHARYGFGSLYLTYRMGGDYEAVQFHRAQRYTLSGASLISLLVRGTGDFGVDFITPQGIERVAIPVTPEWQYATVNVPAGATAIAGFSASGAGGLSGAVYIDQLMAHYGTAAQDITPPVIESFVYDPISGVVTAQITDNYPMPITADMVTLTLDAQTVMSTYDSETGRLIAILDALPSGIHRLSVAVRDYFLNTARADLVVGETAEALFADMEGHWARDYAEYLRIQGVLPGEPDFNPQVQVYNEMAAVMISRFMGTDVTLYQDKEMPFADAHLISDWAWDHVKAMYYAGIMVGSIDSAGVRTYNPQAATTRAQVMTILGRTIPRGYAYSPATFDDNADIPAWARDHVDLLCGLGIVNGYAGTNQVRPNGTITRAEVVSLFFKLY